MADRTPLAPPARRGVRAAVGALAGLALLAGCGGDAGSASSTSSSTTSSTTTSTTTEPTTTASTAPARPVGYAPTAPAAAAELKDAWEAGDQARAGAIAPPEVVAALWAVPNTGWETYGCQTERPEVVTNRCNWRNRSTGGFIQVNTERFDQGWQVTTVRVTQD